MGRNSERKERKATQATMKCFRFSEGRMAVVGEPWKGTRIESFGLDEPRMREEKGVVRRRSGMVSFCLGRGGGNKP